MGKIMSSLGKKATRPLRDFNLEQRAFKEITKEKRPAAPRHQSTVHLIEKSIQNQPEEVKKSLETKDDNLLKRLKEVYVKSEDVTPKQQIRQNPNRPLPTDRTLVSDPEYGFFEPKSVPYGKITLRDAVDAITKHQQDPELWTTNKISYEFKLDTGLTEKVLHHFSTFVLIMPRDAKTAKLTTERLKTSPLAAPYTVRQLPAPTTEATDTTDSDPFKSSATVPSLKESISNLTASSKKTVDRSETLSERRESSPTKEKS